MANDNQQPLLVAGQLPKECYESLQDFVNDLPNVLLFPLDAVEIIKGAKGDEGPKGSKGAKGDAGQDGSNLTLFDIIVSIPDNVAYVEFDVFSGWETASYTIRHSGLVSNIVPIVYDPANGIVGVGSVVAVYNTPSPTKIRCYFVFAGAITATPDENHILQIAYHQ